MKHWHYEVDATSLNCPMPLLKMKMALNKAEIGETILVKATDSASRRDFKAFINMTPHTLEIKVEEKLFFYWITKNKQDS